MKRTRIILVQDKYFHMKVEWGIIVQNENQNCRENNTNIYIFFRTTHLVKYASPNKI